MTPLPVTAASGAAPAAAPTAPARASFGSLLEARTPFPAPAAPSPSPSHRALSAIAGVERAQARLEAVLQAARAGRTFTAAELIGLQAEAYRCTQIVDLASKVVEGGAQSVKHALNTQL